MDGIMGMNVLSLFDGMSCGQIALERAGIEVDNYYASEIEQYSIDVTQVNYPNTIQLGDVENWESWDLLKIDLILAGSPCQGFSFAGKQLAFNDPRSKLFFTFEAIKSSYNSDYFLLENVLMKDQFINVITERMKVAPILIDSALVSAQGRKRMYWTNIPYVYQPEDKGILLKDIIHEFEENNIDLSDYMVPVDRAIQIFNKEAKKGKIASVYIDSLENTIYVVHGRNIVILKDSYGNVTKNRDYLFGCITPDRVNKRQNGQRFSDGKKFYTLTVQDRHGILTDGYIRKLTPLENERLQTVPEGYTSSASKANRYKMLGNGWTVDVIAHILKGLSKDEAQVIKNPFDWMKG